MDFRKMVVRLIIISTCVRCLIAVFTGLGNDEVYYWTYSQHLQWNYFDHPPMVALLMQALVRLTGFFPKPFSAAIGGNRGIGSEYPADHFFIRIEKDKRM